MKPTEYYQSKCAEIGDKEVLNVASCMVDYIGEQNSVRLEVLCARTRLHERQVRDILETLVVEHGWPIGAHAGKAGRWIIANEDERWRVIGDLESRYKALRDRREALITAKVPSQLEINMQAAKAMQTGLWGASGQ